MNVQNVIKQYRSTNDNDLKYMAIKEELPISEVSENLSEYVNQLLIPALMGESDAEIVNLISFQVFPHVVESCILDAKAGTWFDDIIVHPLIQQMGSGRTTIAIQTLKMICRKASEHGVRLGTHRQLIEEFLKKCDNTILSIETLYFLILCYYDLHYRLPPLILDQVLKMIRFAPFGDISKLLIRESVNRASRDAILEVVNRMNLHELEAASENWWRLSPVIINIFHLKLIPSLTNQKTRDSAMKILFNLQPFYTIKRLDGNTFLGRDSEELLMKSLQNLIQQSSDLRQEIPVIDPMQQDDSDTDSDVAQMAYLTELPSDEDEDIEFEGDIDDACPRAQLISQEENFCNFCRDILDKLSVQPPSYKDLPPTAHRLLKRENEDLSSLSQLQAALEEFSQLALTVPAPNLPWSQICQDLILPRIVYDKTFVQKLKAGNLTQSIDEGATLRASAQTALQLFLPHLDFKTVCLVLEYELRNGLRDVDSTVRQLAVRVVTSLLAAHYSTIIGLQYEWYAALLLQDDDRDVAAQALRMHLRNNYPAN